MKVHEFIEKFLPDKEQNETYHKYQIIRGKLDDVRTPEQIVRCFEEIYRLEDILFEIALQNRDDIICEKQRENCYNAFPDKLLSWTLNKLPIYEAEQPKI